MNDASTDEIKLNDLMFQVLDQAVAEIRDAGTPLIPFSISETVTEEKTLKRYIADRLEESVEQGKKAIEASKDTILRYAMAWDGFVTIEGKKWDAIVVEAGDKVSETAIVICQRYQDKEIIGNPALIGKPLSRIK
jgi:hypothetical protein